MKVTTTTVFALSTAVLGFPAEAEKSYGGIKPSDWRPQGPNDVRSPCPGLNSFANHGFLPHSGKGLTIDILKEGFKNAVNVGPDFAEFAGKMGLELSGKNTFDLDDLNVHNAIEHDASLSRQDAYFGNFHTFNKDVFENQTVQYFEDDKIDPTHMAALRMARMMDSKKRNPEYKLSKEHKTDAFTEASLIISVFGNPQTGIVDEPHYVRYWFRNRRLPYALGWTPRKHETNVTTLGKMVQKIRSKTPQDFKGLDEEYEFRAH